MLSRDDAGGNPVSGQLLNDRGGCVDRRPVEHREPDRVQVVGVFVRDEHVSGAYERLVLGPHSRVDEQRAALVLDADTRVGVFDQLHMNSLAVSAAALTALEAGHRE